ELGGAPVAEGQDLREVVLRVQSANDVLGHLPNNQALFSTLAPHLTLHELQRVRTALEAREPHRGLHELGNGRTHTRGHWPARGVTKMRKLGRGHTSPSRVRRVRPCTKL